METSDDKIYVAIVDDDESVRRALARLMRASGMQAITYPSSEHFLKDQKRPQFDCLVLDVQLATGTGIELQNQLAFAGNQLPIIFITANDEPSLRERALSAGCVGFFRKTAPGSEVLAAIRKAVDLKKRNP